MKIEFNNMRKECANLSKEAFSRWFYVNKAWSGQLIYIGIKHFVFTIDLRKDIYKDMVFRSNK